MIKKKVLITPEGFSKIKIDKNLFSKKIQYTHNGKIFNSKKVLKETLKNYDGCIIGSEKIDKQVIDCCPKLKGIVRFGIGLDNIDVPYAKKKGIIVKNIKAKSISDAVSIHTISLILAVTQNLKLHFANAKKGIWLRHLNLLPKDVSVGVVGAGNIGLKVINYLVTLGFKVNYFSRKKKIKLKKLNVKFFSDIDKLIKKSDIITLHIPSINNKQPLLDQNKLSKIKNKCLINLSRGSVVDEKAILKNLNNKKIKFYATDVFSYEPPSKISKKLLIHPNVISTAHVGGYNKTTLKEVSENAICKINDILN
jgi:D-3-phosphoglycerate dehydrogenase